MIASATGNTNLISLSFLAGANSGETPVDANGSAARRILDALSSKCAKLTRAQHGF
jgi:hypothetical protein